MRTDPVFHRMTILLAASLVWTGCSAIENPIPAVVEIASRFEPAFLLQPSNTPFLPARDTPTATPTDPPTATPEPADTETLPAVIPWTATSTNTVVVLPSVTPVTPKAYIAPTKTLQPPRVYPTATHKVKTAAPAAKEKPAEAEDEKSVPAATETPAPTATAEQAAATEIHTAEDAPYPPPDDGEADPSTPESTATPITPSPTASPTASPTRTPLPTATRTNTPVVPNVGCATFNFEWEAQVAELLNQERAKYGLPPWRLNSILTNTARAHSVDMVVNKFMSHTGSDGRTPKQRIAQAGFIGGWWGEIIAGGNPTIAVNWWMNEPGHRAQIINTHYTDFGVGYAYCPGQGWFTVDQGGP